MSDAVSVGDSTNVGEWAALLLSIEPGSLTAVPGCATQPLSRLEVSMEYGEYGSYRGILPSACIDRGSEPLPAIGTYPRAGERWGYSCPLGLWYEAPFIELEA